MKNIFQTQDKLSKEEQRQLMMPNGYWAQSVGENMFYGNAEVIDKLIELIPLRNFGVVVDVGCVPGYGLLKLNQKFPNSLVIGVDPSVDMIQMAKQKNANLIDKGIVKVIQGQSPILPMKKHSVDVITAVNVIYFWPDLVTHFRHYAEILIPQGYIFLYFTDKKSLKKQIDEKDGIYRFYEEREVKNALNKAGFKEYKAFKIQREINQTGYIIAARLG